MTTANTHCYYNGGLAEIVPRPSKLTFSFLRHWLSGDGSFGRAMKLLDLPYVKRPQPLVALVNGQLNVDLIEEEKTLYQQTLFSYKPQRQAADTPRLFFNWKKIVSLACWMGTLQLLQKQSVWIAKPDETVLLAQKLAQDIPQVVDQKTLVEIDKILTHSVWPQVIAVGAVAEFFSVFVQKEIKEDEKVLNFISRQVAEKDWFFLSVKDQYLVKSGKLAFSEYISAYGLRADWDYELTCPRWREIPNEIKKRIDQSLRPPLVQIEKPALSPKLERYVDALIKLQILRAQSRCKALEFIDGLRHLIIKQVGKKDIKDAICEQLLGLSQPSQTFIIDNAIEYESNIQTSRGEGMGVSSGCVQGTVKYIHSVVEMIPPDTICIFPNASPEYSLLFPKCSGIIFLQGGRTSHGAIVAREYGIAALVDAQAKYIKEGERIEVEGARGKWNIIST